VQNRHPADRLADVRSEIRQLEAEEEQLRAHLLEHPQDRTGQEYTAIVGSQSRRRMDLKALADEIGASVLARFTSFRSMVVVRLRELSGG
jgi:nitrogenase molybdenum-iron protein alpha/beta subunit